MDLQPISTKQLRQDLPAIKERLLSGQSFYWIDRSKPVGLIQPLPQNPKTTKTKKQQVEEYEKLVKSLAGGIKLKRYPSPKELNKIIDQEYQLYG